MKKMLMLYGGEAALYTEVSDSLVFLIQSQPHLFPSYFFRSNTKCHKKNKYPPPPPLFGKIPKYFLFCIDGFH
jgi:hypothetical protein